MKKKKQSQKNMPVHTKKKKGSGVGKELAMTAGKEVVKQVAAHAIKTGIKAIVSNHSEWWKLPAKLHSGINYARPTAIFDATNQHRIELTNVNSFFTYPLNTDKLATNAQANANLLMIAEQVIKKIRLEMRSNLTYTVEEVAKYLEIINALDAEVENVIRILRTSMTSNTKVQNFSKLSTSYIQEFIQGATVSISPMFNSVDTVNDYLSKLIRYLTDVRQLQVPKYLFERNRWLFGNIFTDETNNAKTQYYQNYLLGEIIESGGEIKLLCSMEDTTTSSTMDINVRMSNIEKIIQYINTVGSARLNFGTIAADLEKSAIPTIELGKDAFDQVNTLTPIVPIYDDTYFRALDNMQDISNLNIIAALRSDGAFDNVIIDTNMSNIDSAATTSTLQFTLPYSVSGSDIYQSLDMGYWLPQSGWLVPIGTVALGATTVSNLATQVSFVGSSIVVNYETNIPKEWAYTLAFANTIDHHAYSNFITLKSGDTAIDSIVPIKNISLRAAVSNLVVEDIHYLANLGLVVDSDD